MRAGEASITAQRVAAHRLTFDRVEAAYGDPDADVRLARDVAASARADLASPMSRYLAARTTFFDRAVVGCIDAGITQVVVAAAGYDGRALRYAKPGVRWFEVDHPDTQRDKRERLDRLGIDTEHITFVAADFTVDDVANALGEAGHDASRTSLLLCEGVAVYLDRDVLVSLLRSLRAVANSRSRLAISVSVDTGDAGLSQRRARFQSAVAAMGEPARTVLTVDGASALFAECGWAPADGQERARRAGLVMATPR
jgi:methyltransferase (TIGR00027 family)